MNLNGASVLLTGATGGIGHAIARRLHARGATLILTGRRTDILEPLAAEVAGRALAVDLADRGQLDQLTAEAGKVDVLVANAAIPASGHLHSFSEEEIDRALEVNLRAPIILARRLTEAMVARGRGHVVLVSSLAGRTSTPASSVYSATKFGLRGFARGLRGDLIDTGVGVSVVFPGFVRDAGMFAESGVKLPSYVGTSTPDQVADGVVSAIERDRGEVTVAPLGMKAMTTFAELAPDTSAKVALRMGSARLATTIAQRQGDKR